MDKHQQYMQRCLQLAQKGLGNTYPNPLVGCVIVYQDQIIGEGWHQKAGEAHAEVNAIASVDDKRLLKKATLYVSLEPCSHYGKTPPCSDLIIQHQLKKVVIGTIDPFAKVAGRGIQKLMQAGCDVNLGVLENECKALNKRFFTFHQQKRPYIILKWAESKDGFIAPNSQETGKPIWISNNKAKQLVHKWRAEEQAILVGTQTAVNDNPQLNTRLWKGNHPTRLVLDRQLRIPATHQVLDASIPTIILTEKQAESQPNLQFKKLDFSQAIPQQIGKLCHEQALQSIIIEGGQQTLQQFIDADYWDEARVFTSENLLSSGIAAPKIDQQPQQSISIADNQLKYYVND